MHRSLSTCIFVLALLTAALPTAAQPEKEPPALSAKELRELAEKTRGKHDIPALAVGIARDGKPPVLSVVGVRKRGADTLAGDDDQWHLGSNTKPMTALLIAILIDLGLLDWDTPLAQIFPEHSAKWDDELKKVTPMHLLTHTSGLPPLGPLGIFLLVGSKGTPAEDRESLMKSLNSLKLTKKPGEKYEYSNLGYIVLGAIIDKRGKATWEEQIEKKVFQPLGIKHWGFGPVDKKEPVLHPWPHKNDGKPASADGVMDNPPILNSAGRVRMSVGDYHRFLAHTLKLARGEKGMLKPATAEKVFSNPYSVGPHSLSGWVGFRKKPMDKGLVLGHDGSNTFNYCTALVLPDQNKAYCVLTNQGAPGGPGSKACRDLHKELRGKK